MDLRNFSPRKRVRAESGGESDQEDVGDLPPTNSQGLLGGSVSSKAQQRKLYKARLSYKKEWEQNILGCIAKQGMFCKLCQKRGNPPSTARGAWTARGVQDWKHTTEQLREHGHSKWQRDAILHARMAEQGEEQSVLQLQCSAATKEAEERRVKNRTILLKLLRSIYFLAKNCLPLTTTFDQLVQLQIANGDGVVQQHVEEGPQNAQYTSKFSAVMLLEAIDTWLDRRLRGVFCMVFKNKCWTYDTTSLSSTT